MQWRFSHFSELNLNWAEPSFPHANSIPYGSVIINWNRSCCARPKKAPRKKIKFTKLINKFGEVAKTKITNCFIYWFWLHFLLQNWVDGNHPVGVSQKKSARRNAYDTTACYMLAAIPHRTPYALMSHFFSSLWFNVEAPSSYKNRFVFQIIVIRLIPVFGIV